MTPYLQIPPSVPPRVRELALAIAGDQQIPHQQALAIEREVAGAQLEGMLLLQRGAVGRIGSEGKFAQVLRRGAGVLAKLALQLQELVPEEAQLRRVHVLRLRPSRKRPC